MRIIEIAFKCELFHFKSPDHAYSV